MKNLLLLLFLLPIALSAQTTATQIATDGSGQDVLFLPGFASLPEVWESTRAGIALPHRAHLVTYAGFGDAPAVELPWYDKVRDDLIAYVEEQSLTDVIVVGHSMGGMLAIELAAALPQRIDRLVLVDVLPDIRRVMMPGVPAEQITYDNPYSQQMMNLSDSAFSAQTAMMAGNMTEDTLWAARLQEWMLAADRTTYVNGYTDLLKVDLTDTLANVTAHTLILAAPFPSVDLVEETLADQYARLAHKQIAIAPSGRHYLMLDRPEWLLGHLNVFLAEDE